MTTPAKEAWWRALLTPARVRKLLVYVVTVTGFLLAQNLLHGDAERWAEVGLGASGLFGIYAIPNRIGIPGEFVPGEPAVTPAP